MIEGFWSAGTVAVTAGSVGALTDDGDGDIEGEDETRAVGGKASGNVSPPGQTSCADA